jgi:hypothetical protein
MSCRPSYGRWGSRLLQRHCKSWVGARSGFMGWRWRVIRRAVGQPSLSSEAMLVFQ